jgi:hypothetical protein
VAPWAVVRSSGLVHSALIFGPILPTRSRSREGFNLQTYGGGNEPSQASDDGAVLSVFNDGGGGVQWRSSSKVHSSGGSAGGGLLLQALNRRGRSWQGRSMALAC